MRWRAEKAIEGYRVTEVPLASSEDCGCNGAFVFRGPCGRDLKVIVSDGSSWDESGLAGPPWEHASVSCQDGTPTWEEMDFVKRLLWRDDELVVQFHVPRNMRVNTHPNCLHMWKPKGEDIPLPPIQCV